MRIVSLLPAATEIICVGLYEELIVVSHGCSYPPSVNKKLRVSYTDIDYDSISSRDIDMHVEESMHAKRSLYHLNTKNHNSIVSSI